MSTEMERVQRSIDSVFRHRGDEAEYFAPGNGVAISCLVIKDSGDKDIDFGAGRPVSQGNTVDVRKSDVEVMLRGGRVVILETEEELKVVGSPRSDDPHRLIWTATVA